MKKVIIGIHGLGNKPPKQTLQNWWRDAILEGLTNIGKSRVNIPFEMAYWADILHKTPLNINCHDKSDPLCLDEPYVKGISTKRINKDSFIVKVMQYVEEQLDKIFLNEDFTINFKEVTDKLIHRYFFELESYYNDNLDTHIKKDISIKEKIQERLISVLTKYKDYEITLIAHSMGSIVAFDVLSKLPSDFTINTFITIGSPLGLPIIGSRIFAEQKKINENLKHPLTPDSIENAWFNMSDKLDNIALDHTLQDDFEVNRFNVGPQDFFVYNNYEINGEANAHKSYGYLRTKEMAGIINSLLPVTGRDKFVRNYNMISGKIISGLNKISNLFQRK